MSEVPAVGARCTFPWCRRGRSRMRPAADDHARRLGRKGPLRTM